MLTRSQVATILGKSIATVRRMEGTELHPLRSRAGVHLFDPHEVRAIRDGKRTARSALHGEALHRHAWLDEPRRAEHATSVERSEPGSPSLNTEQLAQLLRNAHAAGATDERERLDAQRKREQEIANRQRDTEQQALVAVKANAIQFLGSLSDREFRRLARDPEFMWLLDELEQS